jgi:hypothetical protein
MKIRKAIAYAYPTSNHARELDCGKSGCYYVSQSMLREDHTWSPPYIAQGAEGFTNRHDPDLLAFFEECDGVQCPYGNAS